MEYEISRRQFVQTLMAGVVGGSFISSCQETSSTGTIPTRPLGKTGERVSIIGYGGYDSVVDKSDSESIKLMHEALENGITFYDNAWEYNKGRSEEVMGKAFAESSKRDKIFLMTKVCARDYKGAVSQINDSLRRLKTDRIDLLQFHSIQYEGDKERIFDPENGALKAVQEFKEAGKVRFIGFSGHRSPDIHLAMLDMPLEWDAVQLPINVIDAHFESFQNRVLPVLNERKIGSLGMKSLSAGNAKLPRDLNLSPALCRHYALSTPISTLVCGIQTREELMSDLAIARDFKPLTEEKIEELINISKEKGLTLSVERYKDPKGGYGCSYHSKVLEGEMG